MKAELRFEGKEELFCTQEELTRKHRLVNKYNKTIRP
jgi:hypothetical protein